MYNVDNDLRQPSPPVADDGPTSLALPHLTLVNHCRSLKYILSCLVMSLMNLKAAIASRPLSFKLKPGSLSTPLAHL